MAAFTWDKAWLNVNMTKSINFAEVAIEKWAENDATVQSAKNLSTHLQIWKQICGGNEKSCRSMKRTLLDAVFQLAIENKVPIPARIRGALVDRHAADAKILISISDLSKLDDLISIANPLPCKNDEFNPFKPRAALVDDCIPTVCKTFHRLTMTELLFPNIVRASTDADFIFVVKVATRMQAEVSKLNVPDDTPDEIEEAVADSLTCLRATILAFDQTSSSTEFLPSFKHVIGWTKGGIIGACRNAFEINEAAKTRVHDFQAKMQEFATLMPQITTRRLALISKPMELSVDSIPLLTAEIEFVATAATQLRGGSLKTFSHELAFEITRVCRGILEKKGDHDNGAAALAAAHNMHKLVRAAQALRAKTRELQALLVDVEQFLKDTQSGEVAGQAFVLCADFATTPFHMEFLCSDPNKLASALQPIRETLTLLSTEDVKKHKIFHAALGTIVENMGMVAIDKTFKVDGSEHLVFDVMSGLAALVTIEKARTKMDRFTSLVKALVNAARCVESLAAGDRLDEASTIEETKVDEARRYWDALKFWIHASKGDKIIATIMGLSTSTVDAAFKLISTFASKRFGELYAKVQEALKLNKHIIDGSVADVGDISELVKFEHSVRGLVRPPQPRQVNALAVQTRGHHQKH
jgi:hypothetical protein